MLPVTMTFVRSFIARVGRRTAAASSSGSRRFRDRARPPLCLVRHQLKLPTLLKKGPLSGPDSVLYMLGQGVARAAQVVRSGIADLIDGPVDVVYDAAGNIVSVTAPSLSSR